jgi:hypothetical protein
VTLLVLVILAVMWVVVLVPPLLRSRQDSRPSDSVVSFRRQLSTLQRTGPQLRPVGRVAPGRSGPRGLVGVGAHAGTRSAGYGRGRGYGSGYGFQARRTGTSYRMSRAAARRRRQNVLFVLGVAATGTLLLALGSASRYVWYANAVADVALAGYVYLLVQLRKLDEQRQRTLRPAWSSAA